jgi:hypothetical protein
MNTGWLKDKYSSTDYQAAKFRYGVGYSGIEDRI